MLAELGKIINPAITAAKVMDEAPVSYFSSVPPGGGGWKRGTERPVVGLTTAEGAEMERLKVSFSRRELDPVGQSRLAALLDKTEAARLTKQKAARGPAWGAA